ncbi:MAG: enoyl-CoA hydratase [Rhodospirillaceae bacterium]|nr:enoyl-CoA hydratase [Rhodospirillaceae bacterium]|tara:strand:+ start:94 stop:885 length:792 start_codon:yes stop_codon:yes gene_type:complete
MDDNIIVNIEENIATLTLNRPEKRNAFNLEMVDQWRETFKDCVKKKNVHVIVITGNGKAFCSGGDIAELMGARIDMGPEARKKELSEHVHELIKAFQMNDKPVIAAMNGVATGAGLDLALYADLRYAAESAKFAETYVKVGLIPGAGGAWLLPRIVGEAKAYELLWTSEFINADEAHRLGIVNNVFPDQDLMPHVMRIAKQISQGPQSANRAIKRAIIHGRNSDLFASLDHISSTYGLIATGADHKEAVSAFLEKRPPKFVKT